MEEGYSFIWVARTTPWLISPSGTQIPLVVDNNVPYLPVGEVEMAAPATFAWVPQLYQAAPATAGRRPCYRKADPSPLDSDEESSPAKARPSPAAPGGPHSDA